MPRMGRSRPSGGWKKKAAFDIFALDEVFDHVFDTPNPEAVKKIIAFTGFEALLARYPKAAETRLRYLRSAVDRWAENGSNQDLAKARNHLASLRKVVRPVAADSPFEVHDRVYVHRYEHGWDVGYGTVVARSPLPNPGYSVLMEDSGYEIHVDRTSNLSGPHP